MRVLIVLLFQILFLNVFAQSQRQCIFFENNVYDLSQEQKKEIDDLMKKLDTSLYLRLVGYANKLGSYQSNLKLSENRVKAIKEYIIIKNYPISKIEVSYHGENLAKMNKNSEIESRRVDIIYDIVKSEKFDRSLLSFKKAVKFKINPNKDTVLICPEGSKIHYSANSLIKEDGKKISKESVEISVQEFYKKSDFVMNGLHTQSGDQLLESGGMLNIEAYQGKDKLKLESDRMIKLEFPTKEKKDGMQIFNGDMSHGRLDWIAENIRNNSDLQCEVMPDFPGGDFAMEQYISTNVRYPQQALDKNISGTIYVSFVIDTNGKTTNVKAENKLGYGLEKEAIRVVRNMPRWKPGMQGGRNVKVQMSIPINFDSEGSDVLRFEMPIGGVFGKYIEEDEGFFSEVINKLFPNRKNGSDLTKEEKTILKKYYDSINEVAIQKRQIIREEKIKNNTISSNELNYYVLESSSLGLINCDRFYKEKLEEFIVESENIQNQTVSIVFKKINSVITNSNLPYYSNKFKSQLPKNYYVTIFSIKREHGKTFYALKEANTDEKSITLDQFKEASLDELKEIAKTLDK